jgi:ActR/RegA family two-component response regulator
MKVLLVDDEVEFVSTLAERLMLRGLDVEWVATLEDALKKADQKFFDVAILDLKMPNGGGLVLKDMLLAKHPNMKFIFSTGYGSEEDFNIIAKQIGEQYYLIKPLDIDILIKKISSILNSD